MALEAEDDNFFNPLPNDFDDTGEELSILKIAKTPNVKDINLEEIKKGIIATESIRYKIYQRKYK